MKKLTFLFTAVVLIGGISAFTVNKIKSLNEEKAITDMLERCYIHGAFNELNPQAMSEGFHKDFAILMGWEFLFYVLIVVGGMILMAYLSTIKNPMGSNAFLSMAYQADTSQLASAMKRIFIARKQLQTGGK